MLIAMMSKSYETIEEHADVEWKFARSKLYMEYIKEGKIFSPMIKYMSYYVIFLFRRYITSSIQYNSNTKKCL